MVSQQELQSLVSKSKLPIPGQQVLAGYIPSFGQYAAARLADLLSSGSFDPSESQSRYLEWAGVIAKIMNSLRAGDYKSAVEEISRMLLNVDYERGRIFLPLFYDIRAFLVEHPGTDQASLKEALNEAENKHVRFLSAAELKAIVQTDLIYFVRKGEDLVADFRYSYYVASPEYDGGEWGRQFLPPLKKNQELLGEKLTAGGADIAPTVEHWLVEYDAFSGKLAPQRQALDRLHFVQNFQYAKALSKDDQAVLLKLCELYDWFSDPFVTEAELEEFEDIAPATTRPGLVRTDVQVEEDDDTAIEDAGQTPGSSSEYGPSVSAQDHASPNIQGVLVQTPLGVSDNSGLDVRSSEPAVASPELPTIDSKPEKPIPPSPVVTKKENARTVSPNVVVPKENQLPKIPFVPSRPPVIPMAAQPVPKQGSAVRLAKPVPSMDELKHEAEAKRDSVQADIDSKLNSLKKKSGE